MYLSGRLNSSVLEMLSPSTVALRDSLLLPRPESSLEEEISILGMMFSARASAIESEGLVGFLTFFTCVFLGF